MRVRVRVRVGAYSSRLHRSCARLERDARVSVWPRPCARMLARRSSRMSASASSRRSSCPPTWRSMRRIRSCVRSHRIRLEGAEDWLSDKAVPSHQRQSRACKRARVGPGSKARVLACVITSLASSESAMRVCGWASPWMSRAASSAARRVTSASSSSPASSSTWAHNGAS